MSSSESGFSFSKERNPFSTSQRATRTSWTIPVNPWSDRRKSPSPSSARPDSFANRAVSSPMNASTFR